MHNQDNMNTDNDRSQDASNSDAAKFNADEQEKVINERQATEYDNAENINADTTTEPNANKPPLTTQGDIDEIEENMGGTTNLPLDKLKQEGDPEGK